MTLKRRVLLYTATGVYLQQVNIHSLFDSYHHTHIEL
jgi:hypothetical protein